MVTLEETIRQLSENAGAVRALVGGISDAQAAWQPAPDAWPMRRVMEHVFYEERADFRAHLQELFHDPPLAWGALAAPGIPVESCRQALDGFLAERQISIDWLKALPAPDWSRSIRASFAGGEVIELRAGDVLASWLEHDFLHLRQMIELQYAWTLEQARPYTVQYAGDW